MPVFVLFGRPPTYVDSGQGGSVALSEPTSEDADNPGPVATSVERIMNLKTLLQSKVLV